MRFWLNRCVSVAVGAVLVTGAAGALSAAPRVSPCGAPGAAAAQQSTLDRLTIVLAGDTGFNATDAKVDAKGITKGKQLIGFADTLAGVASAIDGDLAFVNLETVVTDRNNLPPQGRGKGAFRFRSHPDALKALIDSGFNLFSLANNHAYDYGAQGIEETLYHLAVANAATPIAFAGIGSNFDEATRPGCLDLDGTRIGFSAIGILTGDQPQARASEDKAGQANYRDQPDFAAVVDKLMALPADYRILSVHYGVEGRVVPDERQLADLRTFAAEGKGIDLIAGHHPHVVQGVELNGKSLIFYGLGNFLHPGTAEPAKFGLCRDYGLLAKVHLARIDGAWTVEAIEAIPLTRTQMRPERFTSDEGRKRIYALNHLAAGLDDGKNAKGVRFTPRPDGSGLYCADGAAALGGDLGALCQGWQKPGDPDTALAATIAAACADKPFYGKPALVRRKVPQRRASPSPSPFGAAGPQVP